MISCEEDPEEGEEEADEFRFLEWVERKSECLKNVDAMSRMSVMRSQSNLRSSTCLAKKE